MRARATLYRRRNGEYGAAYRGVQDTGYDVRRSGKTYTVFDHEGEMLVGNVERYEAETAIARDWDRAMTPRRVRP